MGAQEHRMRAERTARWWSLEPDADNGHGGILYVLHGYGQLAEHFIRKFEAQRASGWRVIAPEGAHRFYLKGTEGRVGASWMTREARLDDIADYVQALDALRESVHADSSKPEVLLGFSQGAATALRWAALGRQGSGSWTGVIAHSGVIPPDLPDHDGDLSAAPGLHLLLGTEDPHVVDAKERFDAAEQSWLRAGGRADGLHFWSFEGGHAIDSDAVQRILSSWT